MLNIYDIHKNFGKIQAVNGLSFHVGRGEILGFLGPNGAGKSTTMRMITGFLRPSSGSAAIAGYDIQTDSLKAKKHLGYLPENAPVYGDMTVLAFLRFVASVRGYRGQRLRQCLDRTLEHCSLTSVIHRPIHTLSRGFRQRVCFAQSILHEPDVLIMDEPTDGLDPNQKFLVRKMIREMAKEKAIVISTHILEEVDAVCSRCIIINNGQMVAEGTPETLRLQSPAGRLDDVFRQLTIPKSEVMAT
ncbi:MAG: ABC transporter ATP-binding protein [Spartobacteria bacterium]|nr:ABC transporter ATP-binding protein [Spartobacteria bacterium]